MSLLAWWDEPWADDIDFDVEPCPALWADESLLISAGVISWSAAASVFDHSDD